ncbi:MAG TPA: HEAT repeat domain-containing protein [Gemmataceae bacterium]|nr:HEAT repeat domain-containing protein [Gemmataceae bacterium]
MRTRVILFLGVSALTLAASGLGQAADGDAAADELTVKAAGLPMDGPGLLEFFRLRTKGEVAPERLAALIEQLGAKDDATREKAAVELAAVGPPAAPALRAAASDGDAAEKSGLARRCLTAVGPDGVGVTAAAVRLVARRKPDGAAAALLAYLPYADDPSLQDEIKLALSSMAYRDGKAEPALLQALADESPIRRAAAVEVLCQNGLAEPRDQLRKLLSDPKPSVQLRAGLALADVHDPAAVDTLIDLLAKAPLSQGRAAEDYLSNLAGDQSPKDTLTDEASREKIGKEWAGWWRSTEGAVSLEEFRKRTLTELDNDKADKLIHQLGDKEFDVRQKARLELQAMGIVVVRKLRAVANDSDQEVSQNARYVLQEIDKDQGAPLSPVWARIVALRKPSGAAEALTAYIPFCEDEDLLAGVQTALNVVAYPDGRPAPVLVKALDDKNDAARGAAAEALCMGPLGDNLPAVKKLLTDPAPAVRLQTALALAGGSHDRDAVPVLIQLVGEAKLTPEQAGLAEDYLLRTAGDRAPADLPTGDAARDKRSALWAAWWKENGERVALADRYASSSGSRYLGYTLLVQGNANNQIVELAPDGKTERVRITGLSNPQDAVALSSDHYLIAEYGAQRVTERNAKGEILWSKSLPPAPNGQVCFPQGVQRLANGNTFIVCRNQIVECSRDGRDVHVIQRPNNDILTAAKLRNNEIVLVSALGMVERMDATGAPLKSFRMPQQTWTLGNDILPNGNVLVVFQNPMNQVVEYDGDGKQVWSSNAAINPIAAARSPSGTTLIVSQQWPNHMIEVDKNGRTVNDWTLPQNTQTNRVHRR